MSCAGTHAAAETPWRSPPFRFKARFLLPKFLCSPAFSPLADMLLAQAWHTPVPCIRNRSLQQRQGTRWVHGAARRSQGRTSCYVRWKRGANVHLASALRSCCVVLTEYNGRHAAKMSCAGTHAAAETPWRSPPCRFKARFLLPKFLCSPAFSPLADMLLAQARHTPQKQPTSKV